MTTQSISYRIRTLYTTAAALAAANPILLEGEQGTESDTFRRKIGNGTTAWNDLPYITTPKAVTVADPQVGDEFTLFYTERPTALMEVQGIVRGASGASVTVELRYGADRSAAGTLATTSAAVTSTTTGQPLAVQNMPIPAGRYVWLKVTAVNGVVSELNLTLAL